MAQYFRKSSKAPRQFLSRNCCETVLVIFSLIERFQSLESTLAMQAADSALLSRTRNYPIFLKSIATVIHLLGEQEFAFCGLCENICEYECKAENDKQEDNVSGNKHVGNNNSPITFIAGSTSEISNHEKHH